MTGTTFYVTIGFTKTISYHVAFLQTLETQSRGASLMAGRCVESRTFYQQLVPPQQRLLLS